MRTYGKVDAEAHSKVELYLSAKDLVGRDTFSKSDPFAVVLMHDPVEDKWFEVGRTEVIRDKKNPVFEKRFVLEYFFEELQNVVVKLYDEDKKGSTDLKKHDFLGEGSFTLGSLMSAPGNTFAFDLVRPGKKSRGRLIVRGEEQSSSNLKLHLAVACRKLPNRDGFLGKSDPYMVVNKLREDGTFVPVWKSEVIDNNLDPDFPQVSLSVDEIASGDIHRPLKIEFWDKDKKRDDLLSTTDTSVQGLLDLAQSQSETALTAGPKCKRGGTMIIKTARLEKVSSFLDYIRGGCRLNVAVAVDFTASNGNPAQPGTLHYLHPHGNEPNLYQQAIGAILGICEDYDTDKKYEVFGFGAKVSGQVSHCFNLWEGSVDGIEGVNTAYENAVKQVQLSGPTLFTPLINHVSTVAQRSGFDQNSQNYTVLLILTDGVIHDMDQTINSLIDAAQTPLSVIIVGIGDEDFSRMEALDADGSSLQAYGKTAERDVTQFVELSKFEARNLGVRLAKEVLSEIPRQLTSYAKAKNVQPLQPTSPDVDSLTRQLSDSNMLGKGPPYMPKISNVPDIY